VRIQRKDLMEKESKESEEEVSYSAAAKKLREYGVSIDTGNPVFFISNKFIIDFREVVAMSGQDKATVLTKHGKIGVPVECFEALQAGFRVYLRTSDRVSVEIEEPREETEEEMDKRIVDESMERIFEACPNLRVGKKESPSFSSTPKEPEEPGVPSKRAPVGPPPPRKTAKKNRLFGHYELTIDDQTFVLGPDNRKFYARRMDNVLYPLLEKDKECLCNHSLAIASEEDLLSEVKALNPIEIQDPSAF